MPGELLPYVKMEAALLIVVVAVALPLLYPPLATAVVNPMMPAA